MIARELLAAGDFTMIRAELVRALDGDATGALVLTRIHWRAERDDDGWWRGTAVQVADETGLSEDQVNRSVKKLRLAGHLETTKTRGDGAWGHTLSYRVVLSVAVPTAQSRDDTAQSRNVDTAQSRNLPSTKTREKTGSATRELMPIPDDFQRTEADKAWQAEREIPDTFAYEVTEEFRNYWANITGARALKKNWSLTWRNWVSAEWRKTSKFQRANYWEQQREETA